MRKDLTAEDVIISVLEACYVVWFNMSFSVFSQVQLVEKFF